MMKELEKTKRISISAVLFLLVVVISLLTFKKPEFNFVNSSKSTLEFVDNHSHVISLAEFQQLDTASYLLIDVRSNFDYAKGHISHAINIPKSQILDQESIRVIQTAVSGNKPLIVYGENPETANTASLLLFQLGYEQLKLLSIQSYYDNKQFHIAALEVEKPKFDYSETMKEASIQHVQKIAPKTKPAKKKVITQPKKKKRAPEGGC